MAKRERETEEWREREENEWMGERWWLRERKTMARC